ncbi:MAG: Asp-tRNA(Asn)/Glu-tRNA(Gln) amidotransferase subunit GatC [bacterium]
MVTKNDVQYVARLANIDISGEEEEKMTGQLNRILDYVETLNEVDTSETLPFSEVEERQTRLRMDEIKPSMEKKIILDGAPDHTDEFFKVPKVI